MKVKGNDGGDFQRPAPGTYLARAIKVIDLGTQSGEYAGKPTEKRQLVVMWELPTELLTSGESEGQPFVVSKFYTASLNEKSNLRHDLTNWRGKEFTAVELDGFELGNILGAPCLITVTENENGKSRVTGVTSLPKGTKVPKQVNPSLMFSLEPDEFDPAIYEGLSDWFRDTIAKSPEWEALHHGPILHDASYHEDSGFMDGEDLPF